MVEFDGLFDFVEGQEDVVVGAVLEEGVVGFEEEFADAVLAEVALEFAVCFHLLDHLQVAHGLAHVVVGHC